MAGMNNHNTPIDTSEDALRSLNERICGKVNRGSSLSLDDIGDLLDAFKALRAENRTLGMEIISLHAQILDARETALREAAQTSGEWYRNSGHGSPEGEILALIEDGDGQSEAELLRIPPTKRKKIRRSKGDTA